MQEALQVKLKKIFCKKCPKVLLFADIKDGVISKDCPKCGHRNVIVIVNGVEKV